MSIRKKCNQSAISELRSFSYPMLHTGKEWYVGFNAFDPALGVMRRKKIKVNSIKSLTQRRRYAAALIHRLTKKLETGWNPWIESENSRAYHLFTDVCEKYRQYITKLFNDGIYREETYAGYLSYLRNMEAWNGSRPVPMTYIYQFDTAVCTEFLDHIYVDRGNSVQTRNNYLTFLGVFSTFLVQHQYVKTKPCEGLQRIGKSLIKKERTIIERGDMERLRDYLLEHNRHYLLACYLLHYVLIRPKEISMLKIGDINLKKQTITISAGVSKNKKTAVVTLPEKVVGLMLDLEIFNHPSGDYIFSHRFMPGKDFVESKQFRDYWTRTLRPALKFPAQYKFYSLKDTGITEMLRSGCDTLSVKEQARHSSLLMTDIYTPHDIQDANPLLLQYKGVL